MGDWNRNFVEKLIHLYEKNPCLWDVSIPQYKNKLLRENAYQSMTETLANDGLRDVDTKMIKDKIQNIRRTVRKERQKIRQKMKSGSSDDDTYTPSLWYFNLLDFIPDSNECRETTSTSSFAPDDFSAETYPLITSVYTEDSSSLDEESDELTAVFKIPEKPYGKKRKKTDVMTKFIDICSKALQEKIPDEHEATATYLTSKLKKMTDDQRIYAEQLFQTIITLGLLGKLKETHDIVDTKIVNFD